MKKSVAVLAVAVLACFALVSCAKNAAPQTTAKAAQSSLPMSANYASDERGAVEDSAGATNGGSLMTNELSSADRKMVYEASVELEALDIKQAIDAMNALLQQSGGFVANESLQGNAQSEYRRASYTLRVPQKNYSSFLQGLANVGNVISQSQNAEDITANYIDTEARLKSLRVQEERLLDMMSKAGELETLLTIQNQLTEVTYNIERYMSQKNTYDNLLAYSTIGLEIRQVYKVSEGNVGFGQRLQVAAVESWHSFVNGLQGFAIGIIYLLPEIFVLAILGAVAFVIIKIIIKRRKAASKLSAPPPELVQNKIEK